MKKIILLILIVSYFNSNAQILNRVSKKIGISIFEESTEKILSKELGCEIAEKMIRQYDDNIIKNIAKSLSDNPKLKKLIKEDKNALKILTLINKAKVCKNHHLVSHLSNIMKRQGNEKFLNRYIFSVTDDNLIISARHNYNNDKIIREIAKIREIDNVLVIEARQGTNKNNLNDLLNQVKLIPKSKYKVKGKYNLNGFTTTTDNLGNIKEVNGVLTRKPKSKIDRIKHNQKKVRIKKDGVNGDDGGHLVANQFGGGSEMINLIPMKGKKLNRPGGSYYIMEQEWSKALEKGNKIDYKINLIYPKSSKRPEKIIVTYTIEGKKRTTKIFNN